ncbi:CNOT9-like protein [Mya arenaria]|uniref:CCR4-NOT transcription complex subunit 9 n=1 Tax=Mya arenaria TaxID=6604 RepID=A0ABY7F0E7_MYAAR|nr:CNOT9-like protein [Mya arenaria]
MKELKSRTKNCIVTSRMMNPGAAPPTSGSGSLMAGSSMSQDEREKVYQWIGELTSPDTRENALQLNIKKREVVPDLAPMLWHRFGTVAALLQKIVHVYPAITPPHLTAHQSNRGCNALALLQCVVSHPETRSAFLTCMVTLYLHHNRKLLYYHRRHFWSVLLIMHVIGDLLIAVGNGFLNVYRHLVSEALRLCFTDQLKDSTFVNCLNDNNYTAPAKPRKSGRA